MAARFNPDNPTASAASPIRTSYAYNNPQGHTILHSPGRSIDTMRTPTPSRRHGSHLASSVFATTPTRAGHSRDTREARPAHVLDGASESKQTSFEWPIRNVLELKEQLEAGEDDDMGQRSEHPALDPDGVCFDDLGYRLHITPLPDVALGVAVEEGAPAVEPTITLAVISQWALDYGPDEGFDRHLFVGIKPFEREGEHMLGEPTWIWSTSAMHTYSKGSEYWDVTLPTLSELLQHPEVASRDAFSIRVVVKHTSQPGLPPMVHADQQFISRRVTRQAAALLDSARSGDVRFVCLEHSREGDNGRVMARRRVIYAHSEILMHSDYFKAMLSGGFAESADSGTTTLLVDDAAFNTVYWVLRWLYTDELLFSNTDELRSVMAEVRVDQDVARRLLSPESWDYVAINDDGDADDNLDIRTVRSGSSVASRPHSPSALSATSVVSMASSSNAQTQRVSSTSIASTTSTTSTTRGAPSVRGGSAPAVPRKTIPRLQTPSASPHKTKPASAPTSPPASSRSPRTFTTPRRSRPPDPHAHPTAPPPPPSPLAVFFLAHRYGLDELQALARDALLRHLSPETGVTALLATYAFPALHAAILNYVSENWAAISVSPETDRCFEEVSAGVWGEHHGGQVLLGLTRRLTGVRGVGG